MLLRNKYISLTFDVNKLIYYYAQVFPRTYKLKLKMDNEKIKRTYSLSKKTIAKLEQMADKQDRTKSKILERLIDAAN